MAKFYMPLVKAKGRVEDADGVLTELGMKVAHQYAAQWKSGNRAVALERQHPELVGLFYDIRNDEDLAAEHAIPMEKSERFARSSFVVGLNHDTKRLEKAAVFIGPRGGKWQDAKHTIPWSERKERKHRAKPKQEKTGTRKWVDHFKPAPEGKDDYQTVFDFRLSESGADQPIYKKERAAKHVPIIEGFLTTKDGKEIKPPPPGVKKTAIVLMGGPASGKTSTIKHLLGTDDFAGAGFVNVNPDDVKEELPEWKKGLDMGDGTSAKDIAWVLHEESSDVAGEVFNVAQEKGLNIILDGTGKNARKHGERIKRLKEQGYHVQLVMPDVDIQDARKRSIARAEAKGRFVPLEDVLIPAHMAIPGNFEKLARESDEFFLFDTRGEAKDPPRMVWSGGAGKEDIMHDADFVAQFKERGKRLHSQHAKYTSDAAKQKRETRAKLKSKKFVIQGGRTVPREDIKKSESTMRPALTMEQMLANMQKMAGKVHESGKGKFPESAKGEGIIWGDWEDPSYATKRIQYK